MLINAFGALLNKEMDRKQFLVQIGGLLLVVIGVSGLVKSLTESANTDLNRSSHPYRSSGYGSSRFGK